MTIEHTAHSGSQHSTELASVKLVDHFIKQRKDTHEMKAPVTIYCDLFIKTFKCLHCIALRYRPRFLIVKFC